MSTWSRSQWIEDAKKRVLQNTRRTDDYTRELIFLYDEAAVNIEKEIEALFARFARDNGLTEEAARQLLEGREYSVWRKSIEEYIAGASGAASSSKALLELNTLAMKSRITRKEQLLANVYRNMIDLAEDSTARLDALLGDMLKVNYYESCFTIQRGIGLGFGVAKISDRLIRQVLSFPWSEKHYSEAVWGACDHLSALVRREITLGFIQGSSVQKMAKAIDEVMDRGRYNAERLVRTECKYFANQGELMGYKENGITEYQFLGGTEHSGSCTCGELNGRVFHVEEAQPGVNFPPIHPNCLCIIKAHFGKSIFDKREGDPLAGNVKFEEWKKKYVDGAAKDGTISLSETDKRALMQYISSESYKINDKLRRGAALSPQERQFVEDLDHALERLPEHRGTVYRSLSKGLEIEDVDAFVASHIIGVPKQFDAYTSASLEVYDGTMEIQYVIESKCGKDLTAWNPGEKEILFGRSTWFIPTRVEGHTIYMEEVPDE